MDNGEKVDQKAQNEAIKSTKEIFKKKTKNKVKQIIMHAVKAALVPVMMMLLKILLITLLITSIISAITVTIFGDGGGGGENTPKEEDLDVEYKVVTTESVVVKIDEEGSPSAPTRENLEYIIENYGFITNEYGDAKANYTEMLDTILKIQEDKKINAFFTMAICQKESSGGLNELTKLGNNCMSMGAPEGFEGNTFISKPNWVTGNENEEGLWQKFDSKSACIEGFGNLIANSSSYFGGGKYTVKDIGSSYCPGDNWELVVNTFIIDFYSIIGIDVDVTKNTNTEVTEKIDPQTGVSEITIGDRTYKNYKQCVEEYCSEPLAGWESDFPNINLNNSGCAVVSTTIIATGFGHDVNPLTVNEYYKTIGPVHGTALNHYTGLKCSYLSYNKEAVIEQLRKGYPVEVHVNSGPRTYGDSHYFTLLALSESEDQVYVSDPAFLDTATNYTGWLNISLLDESYFDYYYHMEAE